MAVIESVCRGKRVHRAVFLCTYVPGRRERRRRKRRQRYQENRRVGRGKGVKLWCSLLLGFLLEPVLLSFLSEAVIPGTVLALF